MDTGVLRENDPLAGTQADSGAGRQLRSDVGRPRISSVDALRGLVMIVMALDHTRDFLSNTAFLFQPDDVARTTAALFFTRWITHFCAPVFMFTAGMGAWFRGQAKQGSLSAFLFGRGLWLVLLELTVIRAVFSFGRGAVVLEVIWALGLSMIVLAALIHLPERVLAVLCLAVIALHDLFDNVRGGALWSVLHRSGLIVVHDVPAILAYPLVPWFAVMAGGYCFGRVMTFDTERRRRWLVRIGLAATAGFLVLRSIGLYGDPQPWSGAHWLSFLRVTKYPPSLDFLLVTLGPALLLLRLLDGMEFAKRNPLIVFGRVPLFYFVVHLALIHAVTVVLAEAHYADAAFIWNPLPSMGGRDRYPSGYGYSLPVVYVLWIGIVCAMYPLCVWFSGVKRRRRDWWLSYL